MDYKRAYGYEKSIYEYYVVGVVAFHGDDVVNGSCYGRLTSSQENVYLYTLFEKKGTMKTAIKLVLVYFVMQILAALLAMPFAMLYSYAVSGTIDGANTIALAPSMLLGFVGMGGYLWKKGYLKDDGKMWSPVSVPYLGWSIIIGFATIFLIDFVMSKLSFLPDWLGNTFDLLQSGWLGILCISVLGPILEEMLFRGAITKVLLRKYNPVKAIILSALIFGIFHINPAQVVGATLSGILFAWLYYKTGSLVPGILIHILNNGLSVFLSLHYPDAEYTSDLLGEPAYWICLAGAVVLFAVSYKVMNSYRLPD